MSNEKANDIPIVKAIIIEDETKKEDVEAQREFISMFLQKIDEKLKQHSATYQAFVKQAIKEHEMNQHGILNVKTH